MIETKKLGFGLMRLPKIEGADPNSETVSPIDIDQVKEMVDLFMEAGFTYFDTAWAYNWSEDAMRQALVDRYPRDSYTVATKLAAWIDCETREDDEDFKNAVDLLFDELEKSEPEHFAVRQYRKFKLSAGKTAHT